MASFVFNIAKGRTVEFHERVNNNDPAASALKIVVLAEAGLESDDVLKDYDDLGTLLAGASAEVTNTGYARKTLTDADLSAVTVDDVDDQAELTFGTQTWTTVSSGDSWRKLLVVYDADTAAGTDSNIIPVSAHDLLIAGVAVVPTGTNVVVSLPTGYLIAT